MQTLADQSRAAARPSGTSAPAVRPPATAASGRYRLTRRFAVVAFVSIFIVSTASAIFLARLMVTENIHHDAQEVMQFVQSFTPQAIAERFFVDRGDPLAEAAMTPLLEKMAALPDIVHVNVYDTTRTVRWSTRPEMIGQMLDGNPELEEALEGELEVESSLIEDRRYLKPEHAYLQGLDTDFVETYVPIWNAANTTVVGVIELYRRPRALFRMTGAVVRGVWASTFLGGVFLFLSLLWMVRRADRIIETQQQQIVENETMIALGEMSAAVAHSIRNPLASIRSSAELARSLDGDGARESIQEVIGQVDRIANWITQLLVYSQPAATRIGAVNVREAIESTIAEFGRDLDRRRVGVMLDLPPDLPSAQGDGPLLAQVLNTLVTNALEAMPDGGTLTVASAWQRDDGCVRVRIVDTGEGISREQMKRLFVPFSTTKKSGLGVGLPLVRRVLARMGATISIQSTPGQGTSVQLLLKAA